MKKTTKDKKAKTTTTTATTTNPHGIVTTPGPVEGWESETLKKAKKVDSKIGKKRK